jgi:ATP-dependent DNA helicase RecG
MTDAELLALLEDLCRLPHETEWVEFKEAKQGYDFRRLGEYVSALANEANLKDQRYGWLVFGVRDNDRAVVGSRFRENPADLNHLKQEVAAQTTGGLTFLDIHVVQHPEGRVVLFQIPPAPPGVPIAWQGHWYGRDGESLGLLALHELEAIRAQSQTADWSAAICPAATLDDLDPHAVAVARANFQAKNQDKAFARDIDSWSTEAFLDRARLTSAGRVTRTALLLLGRAQAAHHLQPAVAQITWRLEGEERTYEHFGPPFLLTVNDLYARIRNTNQKIDVPQQLVPLEFPKYEKWVVLEALHNAIAHQDYTKQARIIVTETVDRLTFENAGRFFEGDVSDCTLGNRTPRRYRNRFLAEAMVNVNMIDTMGYGIQRMFVQQRRRFYPLLDFD